MGRAAGLMVRGLAVERGGRPILSDLSFDLPNGAALAVTGNNGAGKSTLLRAIAGLLPITRGTIDLELSTDGAQTAIGERVHYVGHANGLKPALSPLDNLSFQRVWSGRAGLSPVDALAVVGLSHAIDFPVGILSAGQRRRVALARLLVSKQPLWLLDEPATAIDAQSEALLVNLINAHVSAGGMLIAAVHAPLAIEARTLRLGA